MQIISNRKSGSISTSLKTWSRFTNWKIHLLCISPPPPLLVTLMPQVGSRCFAKGCEHDSSKMQNVYVISISAGHIWFIILVSFEFIFKLNNIDIGLFILNLKVTRRNSEAFMHKFCSLHYNLNVSKTLR